MAIQQPQQAIINPTGDPALAKYQVNTNSGIYVFETTKDIYVTAVDQTFTQQYIKNETITNEISNIPNAVQFNIDGNFVSDQDFTYSESSDTLNVKNLNIAGIANLGSSGNVKISGGTDGYFLQTDGAGNLVWAAGGSGNGTTGGSNTQVQFNDSGNFGGNIGFTFDKTTGVLTAPILAGNANRVSNIQGSNVSGAVGLATFASTANAVAGSNVSGAVQYATTANSVVVANVTGIGNIATVNLNGSSSNVLYGNGQWASVGGIQSRIANGSSTVNIPTANGDVVINPASTSNIELTTSSLTSVTAPCYIGLPIEYVADTEFNDDITAVQVGWKVIVNSVEYTVTYIDPAPPANQYRITVDGTAGFVSGTSYTFTNPVPVEYTWSIDQYGTMTAPGGGEISQINDDFKIEVTGTDVIDLRTEGGDLILDAEGNLVINGLINSSTGVASLNLTGGNVSLTSTDDNTTSLNMTTTQVELYAGVDVTIASGVIIPGLETDYTDATNVLETLFIQNENEVGYPWGITLPVSYLTYDELIQLEPGTFPNQAACTAQANSTTDAWNLWQDTVEQSNVRITSNELNWIFGSDGILNFPGSALIDTGENNFEVRGANAVNFEAANVVNIYTDTANNGHQWQFGDDGNLTLPSNNSSINYANGSPYGGGGGGSGYIIPYTVDTFVANTPPGFGDITFCNLEGANSAPSTAQKLFINQAASNEQTLGTIFQQWTSNSYRGTLSLNNGSDSQATFNISNGRIYFNPQTYRGFNAGLNQIWSDDCSINQLIITNATAPVFYNTDFLGEDDVFHAKNLDTGNTHVMLNIYGSSQYNPINPNDLWNTFVAFVDNVLYDGETLRTDTSAIRTQFYNNTGNFRGNIPTKDLYQYFTFTENDGADYFGTAPTTTNGSGTGATVRIRVNPNNTYTVLGTANPGSGYIGGETLTVAGTSLGGATPANDLTILIDSVNGDGVITQISYDNGDGVYPWPPNFIEDGDDDQYDTGNYINTNLADEISYANGLPQTDSAAFGGGDYCVMYYQSFFCMVATGVSSSVTDLFYSGNLGFDGDAALNWTGLRSNQDVIANNNARYAYFDCEYLDGELTPTVGTTYNMVLDSAGINLDEFYAYQDINTNDYYFGSNNNWRVESQNNLYVQSYNDMFIQTRVNQRGTGETGPTINIEASDGSPGQREINATAGNGGTVNIRAGDAGSSNDIDSLGNTGGGINITAGAGTGASSAGSVLIEGGQTASPVGIAGNVDIGTYAGPNGNGRVTITTNDGNAHNWAFNADGSTIYPTLTVTRGDRTGTLTGQTLLFGNSAQEALITTPNGTSDINDSQRLVINPGAGYANTTGEGGDIYLYAGRGGSAGGTGGDIKIRGGLGPVDGAGGYIDITGGEAAGNGAGGYIDILGGQSANSTGGRVRIEGGQGTSGAEANITGGTGSAGPGGSVNIAGGVSSNGLSAYGNVNITSGASTWTFDNTGNLTLPSNDFTVNYANGTQVNIGGGSGNTGNVTFDNQIVIGTGDNFGGGGLYLAQGPDSVANAQYLRVRAGDYPTHIHLDTGNNDAYDQYFGADGKYLKLQADGNISIGVDYSSNVWTFDSFHNLTVPGNIKSITTGFSFSADISDIDTRIANVVMVTVTSSPFPELVTGKVTISGVVGTTEANGTWYYQAAEVDQFQLYYDAELTSPVDGTGWPAYVSGGLAVSAGYNDLSVTGGNVDIITNNGNTWTFDDTGNLTLPGTLILPSTLAVVTSTETVSVTNENGDPGGAGAQTVTGTVADNPGINTIQPGWIVTGNNLTATTRVTSVVETSPNFYTITTDTNEANPFTYNDVYTFGEAVYNTWNFSNTGNLTLPTISLGTGVDEQTVVQSQRKIIPGFRYSVEIDGSTPTVVYTATDNSINSMKVTIQIQHQSLGMEFFEVYATQTGGDTYYSVSNRLQPPTIANSTVVVDLNGSNEMEITVTINSGAATSWVTYDATEFGIAVD